MMVVEGLYVHLSCFTAYIKIEADDDNDNNHNNEIICEKENGFEISKTLGTFYDFSMTSRATSKLG
jgi:hypothetical protein